jgi:hypothetical protein
MSTHAVTDVTVHGGYSLVLWEPEAAYAVTGIAVGSL